MTCATITSIITSVSPLTAVSPRYPSSNNHKFTINWCDPNQSTFNVSYLRLYRYIGNKHSCVDINSIPEPPANGSGSNGRTRIIYLIKQLFDPVSGLPKNPREYEQILYNMNGAEQPPLSVVNSIPLSFQDDLSPFYDSGSTSLKSAYGITDASDDRQILNEIYTTQRPIYYLLATYVRGVRDVAPYCIGAHTLTGIVDAFSVKTQVLHNVLHYEHDMIWQNRVPIVLRGSTPSKLRISRTAVDINRIYQEAAQRGPTGRGGYVWVTARQENGEVLRYNLSNGVQSGLGDSNESDGWGHGIAIDLDTGDAITGTGSGEIARFSGSNFNLTRQIYSTRVPSCYGLTNIPGRPSLLGVSERRGNPCSGGVGSIGIYDITTTNTNGTFKGTRNHSGTNGDPYGIASGSDGYVYVAHAGSSRAAWTNAERTDTNCGKSTPAWATGITTDIKNVWPNTNASNSDYHLFINAYLGDGVYMTKGTAAEWRNDTNTQWIKCIAFNSTDNYFRGIGIDGDNNIQGLGWYRGKIYRNAPPNYTNRDGNPLIGETYDSVRLSLWPFSATNTREIEWFLLRRHQTMDNITPRNFNGASRTAKAAWLSLVEFRRHEVEHNPANGSPTSSSYSDIRGWNPDPSQPNTWMYGIRIKPTFTTTQIVDLIREWDNVYGTNPENIAGRQTHPNINHDRSTVLAESSVTTENVSPQSEVKTLANGHRGIICSNYNGYSYQYSDFTGNLLAAAIAETLYNFSLGRPTETPPALNLFLSGTNLPIFVEQNPQCYPWPHTVTRNGIIPVTQTSQTTAISSYDNLDTTFTLVAHFGSYIIDRWVLDVNDYGSVIYTRTDNSIYNENLLNYVSAININHVYQTPSKGRRSYLDTPPIYNEHLTLPYGEFTTPGLINLYNTGDFIPVATIGGVSSVYSCPPTMSTFNSSNKVTVYERWPEPRFFTSVTDDAQFRQNYFRVPPTHPLRGDDRYDKRDRLERLSNISDAVRNEVIIGVEPIDGEFQDRSISRSFATTAWQMKITTDNKWLTPSSINFPRITRNLLQDTQAAFDPLSSIIFQYGTNTITLTTFAETTNTISDRVFSQCINIDEMEPLAYYEILSGRTINPINRSSYVNIPAPNAQFAPGETYISGYAPFVSVTFTQSSLAHTFPISSYTWNFGDIYNDETNIITINATNVIAGGFSWNNDPQKHQVWQTDVSLAAETHVYTMPGRYNTTLTVNASNTSTEDIYTKYPYVEGLTHKYVVEVVEIEPQCGDFYAGPTNPPTTNNIHLISGVSPVSGYFKLDNITVGSFDICTVKWQFGDRIETITNNPPTTETSQGLPINVTPNVYDTIVPYIFESAIPQQFTIGVSAFACFTNTMIDCTPTNKTTGLIYSRIFTEYSDFDLKKSTIDDDGNIIYVFNDNKNNISHTIVLSGGNIKI